MFETTVGLRYADLDTYGRVNNAVYATLIEEARVDYLQAVLPAAMGEITGTGEGAGIVLATLELSFERPLFEADAVTVGVRVAELGETSLEFAYEINDDGDRVATAETTIVVIDRKTGNSRPIPEDWREKIAAFD